MEQYTVLGYLPDGTAVLERFQFEVWEGGRYILVIHPDVYWTKSTVSVDPWIYSIMRRKDGATFAVPVFRTLAQLRARTRVTEEPRRLYGQEVENTAGREASRPRAGELPRLRVGAEIRLESEQRRVRAASPEGERTVVLRVNASRDLHEDLRSKDTAQHGDRSHQSRSERQQALQPSDGVDSY